MGAFNVGCEAVEPEITEFMVYYNSNEDIAGFQFDRLMKVGSWKMIF